MKTWFLLLITAALLLPFSASADTDIVVVPAELSAAFEAVPGKVVLVGDQVMFWSDSATVPSFYFSKAKVRRSSVSNGVLTVELDEPTQISTGSQSRFAFRITGATDTGSIERWFAQPVGATTASTATSTASSTTSSSSASASGPLAGAYTFDAEHTRRFGGNRTGKLVFTKEGLAWESLDDATQSRTWQYKSIRRLDRSNPYELVVDTFADGKYSFKLTTKPIGNEEFSTITDYLAAGRAAARQ